MVTNQNSLLFTEISTSDEASLCGGKRRNRSLLQKGGGKKFTINFNFFHILGAGGGAASGGVIGKGNSGGNTGGDGVVFIF